LISTRVALVCPEWLYFGSFLAIEFLVCAQKRKLLVKHDGVHQGGVHNNYKKKEKKNFDATTWWCRDDN